MASKKDIELFIAIPITIKSLPKKAPKIGFPLFLEKKNIQNGYCHDN